MSKSLPKSLIGKSLEEFSSFLFEQKGKIDDVAAQGLLLRPIKPDPDGDAAQVQGQGDAEIPNKVPDHLTYLFGRYPMDDVFSVTRCNYCERVISSTYMEKHVDECAKIPQVVKDELHLLIYGRKFRIGPTRRVSSTGEKPSTAASRLAKQSSPSPELNLQPPKSSRSSTVSSRTCSSAPSSPTAGSSNASITQSLEKGPPLIPLNYSFPTIKIQKSDSPNSYEGKSKAPPSPVVPSSEPLKIKKEKTLVPPSTPPPSASTMKIKPSVVLKIKGNTSTTTTVPGRVAVDSVSATESVPSPLASVEINQTVTSPKPEVAPVVVKIEPQTPRTIQEAPVPSVVISLGQIPKVELKSPNPTEVIVKPKKKASKHEARKVIPLRERCFNPDEHCGVFDADGIQCKRSLTCKTHSMALRRAVPGRSFPFDSLISTQKQARHKARLAKQATTSPGSPNIGVSALVGSSSDGSSDASRLSLSSASAITSPPASVTTGQQNRPLLPPKSNSTVTLQKLLNSGIQYGDTSIKSPTVFQLNPNRIVASSLSTAVPTVAHPKKKKIKKIKDPGDSAIKLQLVTKEPTGFDYVTHIVPPEYEGMTHPEAPQQIEPSFKNGKNVLLLHEFPGKLFLEPFPFVAVPVGRKNKEKWKRHCPKILVDSDNYHPMAKKLKRTESMERLVLLSAGQWMRHHQKKVSEKLAMGSVSSNDGAVAAQPQPPQPTADSEPVLKKVCFRLHAKKLCRPHHARNGGSYLDVTKHVGPLIEVTQALNGLSTVTPNDFSATPSLANFDSVDMVNIAADGVGQQQQMSPESCEENSSTWMVESIPNIPDAPVGDSELHKLLASQFED